MRIESQGEELLLSSNVAGHVGSAGAPDNIDFAFRFGVTLGDNPVKARQLDKAICEVCVLLLILRLPSMLAMAVPSLLLLL